MKRKKNEKAVRHRARLVVVNDKMQRGFRYLLVEPIGRNFDPDFKPELAPREMLALGVFGGKYMTDCQRQFPRSWFTRAKLSTSGRNSALNYFGVDASQPLSVWRRNAGCTMTTLAAGSSGIAVTTWAGGCPRRTSGRSSAGRRFGGTSRFNGLTTAEISDWSTFRATRRAPRWHVT